MQEHEVKVNPEPAILGLPSSFFQSLPLGQVGYTDRGNGVACKWWAPVASLLLGSLKKDISPTYCLESPDGILEHLEAELVDAVLAGSLKLDRIYDSLQPPRHLLDPELATLPHIQVKLKGPHYDGKRDEPLQEWQGSCLRRRRRRGGARRRSPFPLRPVSFIAAFGELYTNHTNFSASIIRPTCRPR